MPLSQELAGPVLAGLAQHRVYQRGLAMVHVGNDGHITYVVASNHGVRVRLGIRRACERWAQTERNRRLPYINHHID